MRFFNSKRYIALYILFRNYLPIDPAIKSGREVELGPEAGYRIESTGRTNEKLRATTNDHMMMLKSNPRRVASYFQDPRVKYAA